MTANPSNNITPLVLSTAQATDKTPLIPAGVEGVQITELGLRYDADTPLTPEQYNTLFHTVTTLSRASNWLLGDTLELAERTWGNQATGSKYEEASKQTGLSIATLRHIVSCCHSIPIECRRHGLSFTHHLEACQRTDTVTEREAMLERAETERMPMRDFRRELINKQAEKVAASGEDCAPRDFREEFCPRDIQEAQQFPKSYEFSLLRLWAEKGEAGKLTSEERRKLIDCALPLICTLYGLLEQEAAEGRSYAVPFPVGK